MKVSSTALTLEHIHYFGFDSEGNSLSLTAPTASTWIAVAHYNYLETDHLKTECLKNNTIEIGQSPLRFTKTDLQRYAVRKLFYKLLFKLFESHPFHYVNPELEYESIRLLPLKGLILNQSDYPYRLLPNNCYVCFTHSGNQVACAINKSQPIGIDLETHQVSLKIAKRFYNPKEIDWLLTLNTPQQNQALNVLWMLKESTIKTHIADKAKLIKGLKLNLLLAAQQLMSDSFNACNNIVISSNITYSEHHCQYQNYSTVQTTYVYLPNSNLVAVW